MTDLISKPDYGENIIEEGKASLRFQIYLDDIENKFNVPLLPSFTVSQLTGATPQVPASSRPNGFVMVSDETGGQVPAFSDGTSWRRVTDRAVIL